MLLLFINKPGQKRRPGRHCGR